MSAISLFDTFFRMGMTREEAYRECQNQHMFSEHELDDLLKQR